MIFELVKDFAAVLDAMPADHPRRRILKLLEEAIRRDVQFIDRHPTTLFQCMWNTCWWYDCPEAAKHYEEPQGAWLEPAPWEQEGPKLHRLLEAWRIEKERATPVFPWLRSLRAPSPPLGSALRAVLTGNNDRIRCLAVSPDGAVIAAGSDQLKDDFSEPTRGIVRAWDVASGVELWNATSDTSPVDSLIFLSVALLAHSTSDGVVLREMNGGTEIGRLFNGPATLIAGSMDGRRIAVVGAGLAVWDTHLLTELATFQLGHYQADCIAVSPDGRRVAAGLADGTIQVWDVESRNEIARLAGHESVYSHGDGYGVDWSNIWCLSFDPGGWLLASGASDNTIRIWNVMACQEIACLKGHEEVWRKRYQWRGFVRSVTFSPNGDLIASGANDKSVRIWSVTHGSNIACFRGHQGNVTCVAFLADGTRIASGANDGTVRLWGLDGIQAAPHRCDHQSFVDCIAFSADGRIVASGGQDNIICLWDIETGRLLRRLYGHERWITQVVLSDDAELVASASLDHTMRVWRSDDATSVETYHMSGESLHPRVEDLARLVTNLGYSCTAPIARDRFVWKEGEGEMRLVDTRSNQAIVWHSGRFRCVATHPSALLWGGSLFSHVEYYHLENTPSEPGCRETPAIIQRLNGGIAECATRLKDCNSDPAPADNNKRMYRLKIQYAGYGDLDVECLWCGWEAYVERGEAIPDECPNCGASQVAKPDPPDDDTPKV